MTKHSLTKRPSTARNLPESSFPMGSTDLAKGLPASRSREIGNRGSPIRRVRAQGRVCLRVDYHWREPIHPWCDPPAHAIMLPATLSITCSLLFFFSFPFSFLFFFLFIFFSFPLTSLSLFSWWWCNPWQQKICYISLLRRGNGWWAACYLIFCCCCIIFLMYTIYYLFNLTLTTLIFLY